MLQIIVVYFAPFYVFRMQVGTGYRFPAVILAFVINYAAYFAEIYRAGIESIPVGQYEAAEVLGYHFHCGNVHGGKADRSGTDQCASPVGSRCVLLYLQSRGGFFHGVSGEEDILLQIGAVRKYGPFGNESCEKKF